MSEKKQVDRQSIGNNWLFYVITTALLAFVGIALGKLTIGFLVSMLLMLVSGFYPSLSAGMIEVIAHNVGFLMICLFLEVYLRRRKKKSIRALWFAKNSHGIGELAKGAGIGFVLCVASVVTVLLGTDWKLSFQSVDVPVIVLVLLSGVIQAGTEEILFRGYLLKGLMHRYSAGVSIVLSGALFSVTHIMNPGITLLAAVNITLIGMVLAYLAAKRSNLFLVTGIHFMWNFTEEIIFGTPNSGIVFPKSVFALGGGESSLLYNQTFGIEAAVQTVLFWSLLFFAAWRIQRREDK